MSSSRDKKERSAFAGRMSSTLTTVLRIASEEELKFKKRKRVRFNPRLQYNTDVQNQHPPKCIDNGTPQQKSDDLLNPDFGSSADMSSEDLLDLTRVACLIM